MYALSFDCALLRSGTGSVFVGVPEAEIKLGIGLAVKDQADLRKRRVRVLGEVAFNRAENDPGSTLFWKAEYSG